MIQTHDITNTIFTSKTYILYREGAQNAWLVDIGDVEPVFDFLNYHNLIPVGVILTHAHFDHIYGLVSLLDRYPECKVYVTEYSKQALASDKLNMSRYHGEPIIYAGDNVITVSEGETLKLYDNEPPIIFYETPGHNPGCLTMVLDDMIFTGDAYIPGVGANTRLPHSNKQEAQYSLERILQLAEGKRILSGHLIDSQ